MDTTAAASAASSDLCIHCHKYIISRPRKLCRVCHANPDIRNRYPTITSPSPRHGKSVLPPPPKTYPDSSIIPKCPHNLFDGECAICERIQRIKPTLVENEEVTICFLT